MEIRKPENILWMKCKPKLKIFKKYPLYHELNVLSQYSSNQVNTQPRSQGHFPSLGAGREKALGLVGHMISEHPNILGVLNYHMLKGTFKMAVPSSKPKFLSVLR